MRPDGREGPGLPSWGAETATCPAAPPGPEEEEELREQRVKCLNNCAAAELKLGRAEEALAACEAALRISPDNNRALLRRGQVGLASSRTTPLSSARPSSYPPLLSPQLLAEQGRDAEAALILRKALELDPANKVWEAGCEGGRCPTGPGTRSDREGEDPAGVGSGMVGRPTGALPTAAAPRPQVIHTELSRLAKRRSLSSSTAPQNPRHDPIPPPSPACVGRNGCPPRILSARMALTVVSPRRSPAPPTAEGAI